ncbi:hypothetical protein FJ959_09850 [Mesorhizobium sp. B2-2-4]|uniref:hypothetical protein n=1 Tax=unclassified Mesorhizobium TaxID=325217 RepID=UPI0011290A0F|nr:MULTISPECIES: hypothetical protein [unclassified Mesorhizobium]TPM59162.1 hypothetical protein FJ959_09850 [Mesorhizobium sp. B2-2-4]TPM67647.1 hypothetical protein FJ965_10990 [Mesorhizobium sp. B2-2-1]TPN66929.1 hypothetical protein FJ984_15855 [Mesorhizobium sp. B1-1-3]
MTTNEPETMSISMQVALEEEVERLDAAAKASRNRILFLAQSNANLKAQVAEMEAKLAAMEPAEVPAKKPKAN